ncbi:MAG: adenylyl cyclase, adenylate cyclase, class 2 [Candidatus Peregrinibacteria bacterium GW2011_GWE2_39_6]|nr:MAG: adenylyl cyclase, adenylate cyclase, class 2 [Candidatus Peregrinibacteria bacterium GW2011_GWF2_39_17]KKR25178.1 MAG: adenylyl cyclase, adenylate cyclase, class 2 [Candidatus Peregrinibacteria bacterium GW2011_GWE2_39_6]HCW32212.1 hypothetical protein [Candidatus Peregrinibacteria bacterium]
MNTPEIEIKVLGVKPDQIKKDLRALGAKQTFAGLVKCLHFDRPGQPLHSKGKLFRLRRLEGKLGFPSKIEICYKGPKQIIDNCKVREEIETTVENPEQFEFIIKRLGFKITLDNEKIRESFSLENLHFDIDTYPKSPTYMEIEGKDSKSIDQILEKLNLTKYERSTESADELFQRLWPNIDLTWLKF